VKPHVMFLRNACLLPDALDLAPKHFSEAWMSVEETTSAALDVKVRSAGWNFIWLKDVCSRIGVAHTETVAVTKAIDRALKTIKRGFNAAEFDSLRVLRFPGFRVAKVTLHARQIQQDPLLSLSREKTIRQLAVW
jgi:hypothetical protein